MQIHIFTEMCQACFWMHAVTLFLHSNDAFMVFILPLRFFNAAYNIIGIP
jgi:hypothetical protein